jgi:hypothetical protein
MSDRAPYSRVYHSIVDDPKFANVFDNDRRLATWLRLLIVAEQAHPASAYIPAGTNRSAVLALVDAGLIDLGTGSRFRIHGLDAERTRRADAARVGGLASGRSRSVEHSVNGRSTKTNLDEQSKDEQETRQDEQSTARDPVSIYRTLTGKFPKGNSLSWIEQLTRAFGEDAVANVLTVTFSEDPQLSTLLGRTQDRLRSGSSRPRKPRVLEDWERDYRSAVEERYGPEELVVKP